MNKKINIVPYFIVMITLVISSCTYYNDEVCTPRYKDTVIIKRNPCEVVTDGLVACYAFNGNGDDGSGYGNHGTVHGAVFTKDRYGIDSSALYFDGIDDYVIAPDAPILRIRNSITLAAWFKTSDPNLNTDGQKAIIVSKHRTHYKRSYTLLTSDMTSSSEHVGMELFDPYNNGYYIFFYNSYWDDMWHFLVATYDYNNRYAKIFIDGQLILNNYIGRVNLMLNNIPLTIGCYVDPFDSTNQRGFFHGIIDDVQVFDRALTNEEILKIYEH
jgi:hypothetical protein